MKINVNQLNQETFNRIRHQKVKSYSHKMTQKDINNLLIEYIRDLTRDLQKQGFTDDQISQMTFTINYVNY